MRRCAANRGVLHSEHQRVIEMNAKYRLVHFLPDPFSGAQVPIAALVGGEGGVVVTRADHLPGAACLGSPERQSALECVLESIIDARTLDGLPVGAGPQA